MSSSGSDSGSELDHEEEMALLIALERSKVETVGSPDMERRHTSV